MFPIILSFIIFYKKNTSGHEIQASASPLDPRTKIYVISRGWIFSSKISLSAINSIIWYPLDNFIILRVCVFDVILISLYYEFIYEKYQ